MKARNSLLLLLACAASFLAPRPAHAWDEVGHKVVARVAWDHMTPFARERAIALLLAAPADAGIRGLLPEDGRPLAERQRDLFVNTSYWADQIRSRTHVGNRFAHSEWHYVNFFWEQPTPGGPFRERPDKGTVGELITQETRIAGTLGDASRSEADRGIDLAWLIHLVGDAHQPLHNSARITPQDTAGDRGANSFLLGGLYPFNNLHAYWDALPGFSSPWRASDRTESDYIEGIAGRAASRHPLRVMRGALRPGEFQQWGLEGLRVAERAYPVWLERGQRAPYRYKPYAWSLAEPRLTLAGYRLADILNRSIGSPP
jgi:hypothetical protein